MPLSRAIFAAIVLGCGLSAARANTPTVTAAPTSAAAPDTSSSPAGVLRETSQPPRVALLAAPGLPHIDHLVVRKSRRRLYLMDGDRIVRSYKVALGLEPNGPKERDGDFRTPEGWYHLARRNPRSDYFLSIQISYPNSGDLVRARQHHWQPGGSIMIHGLPNRLKNSPWYYRHNDWTDGCIAVSDADMVEIWLLTHDGMPIDILP
ncbi:MAG TPA: L,D-transpeptidase family protein [Steroidobacteraceae bacterium]|jgi:murein L,D-transpeptidase YafK|nr:L,D-transpeptidase family protein [Steroidobacteraceae bacterium]